MKLQLLKIHYILFIALFIAVPSSFAKSQKDIKKNTKTILQSDKYVLKQIIQKMREGHYFNAMTTSLNEQGKNWFTTYGYSLTVDKSSSNSIKVKGIKTSFSDRQHFQGARTLEEITIYETRGKLDVRILFTSWNRDRVILKNVSVKKANNVYFITGHYVSKGKTSYVTIGLKDMGKLI